MLLASLAALPLLLTATISEDVPRRWQEGTVTFQIVPSVVLPAATVHDALEGALASWAGVAEGPALEHDPAAAQVDGPALDGVNAILFATQSWDHDPGELALTFAQRDSRTGIILEADIVVNAVDHAWGGPGGEEGGSYDLQNVLTHEIGHALGLRHLTELDATMFPSIQPGERLKRDLAAPDVDALTALYAGVELTERAAEPAGGCAQVDGTTSAAGLFALITVAGSRRRRAGGSSPR